MNDESQLHFMEKALTEVILCNFYLYEETQSYLVLKDCSVFGFYISVGANALWKNKILFTAEFYIIWYVLKVKKN